jgi:hypothetical protein
MLYRAWYFLRDGGSRRRFLLCGFATALATGALATLASAQTLTGDGSLSCGGPYVIVRGDTLSRVAQRAYGDPMLYTLLVDANRDAFGGDPDRLNVGMSITVPCVDVNGQTRTTEEAADAAQSLAAFPIRC